MTNRFPFAKSGIFLTLVFIIFSSEAWAWGEEGHSIVAEIAQRRLSQNAAQAITQILRANPNATPYPTPSLASISTWADEVRYNGPQPNETYNWHFVDIPRQDTHYDPQTECPKEKPAQGDCVINELLRLRNELRCTTDDQQLRALKFAVHFAGDIHQPSLTIWENAGGNGITFTVDKLQFKGKTCSADKCSAPPD
jgi:S1/P1 Nuclease